MSERVAKILDDAYKAVYEDDLSSAALSSMAMGYLGARIADLEAQNAALKAAIKPFAEFAEHIRPPNHLDTPIYGYNDVELTWRHFRDALLLKDDAE